MSRLGLGIGLSGAGAGASIPAGPPEIPTANILGIWDMQAVSGGKLLDASGNGNDLTLGSFKPTATAYGFIYNGLSQYIDVTTLYNSKIGGQAGPFSFLIVAKVASDANVPIIGTLSGDRSGMVNYWAGSDSARFMAGGTYIFGGMSINQWTAIAGRHVGAGPSDIWINGTKRQSTPTPGASSAATGVRLGVGAFTGAADMEQAYFVLWKALLSDGDMAQAYDAVRVNLAARASGAIALPERT